MEALAAQTELYRKLRQLGFSEPDLFKNYTVNLQGDLLMPGSTKTGDIQGGAVSVGGDATNLGSVSIGESPAELELLHAELREIRRLIEKLALEPKLKDEIKAAALEVESNPTHENVGVVFKALQKVRSYLSTTAAHAGDVTKISNMLEKLSGFLP